MTAIVIFTRCGGGTTNGEPEGDADDPYPAGAVDMAWDPPAIHADGTPMTGLAGYIIHYGPSPGTYVQSIDVGYVTECAVALPLGTWYLAVTAYDVQGNEGPYSNEIVVVLNGSVTQLEGLSPIRLSFTGAPPSRDGDAFPLAVVSFLPADTPSRLTAF